MSICTWEGCTCLAQYPQIATDNEVWANLCEVHHKEMKYTLETAMRSDHAPIVLSRWIKAQGGAKKAARRMMK